VSGGDSGRTGESNPICREGARQKPALCAIHVVLPFWRAATLQRVVYATLAIGFGSSLTKLANAREEALGIHPRCCRHWQRTVHLLITLDRGGTLVPENSSAEQMATPMRKRTHTPMVATEAGAAMTLVPLSLSACE